MRLAIVNNWSILLGFIITFIAFTGMLMASFFPSAMYIDFTPSRSISALEVPLRHFDPDAIEPEVRLMNEIKASLAVSDLSDYEQDALVQGTGFVFERQSSSRYWPRAAAPKTDNAVTSLPSPEVPMRIVIPSIELNAPVVPAPVDFETIDGQEFLQWFVPDEFAAGWHTTSAMLGEPGNTVLNGHHNAFGEVFVSLEQVNEGDIIWVESDHNRYSYQITNKLILPEKYEQLDVRMNNAQWILPSVDERLTLISCWPYESNTHRLILVARPFGQEELVFNME